jgi:hypothetical protein
MGLLRRRGVRRSAVVGAVGLLLLVAAVVASNNARRDTNLFVTPTATPEASKQAARDWRFERSVLAPADPNMVGGDLRAALALPDGGWLLSVDARPQRCLVFDSWSCGMLAHVANTLVRLDANGTVLAQRTGAPAIYRGEVFASRHIAVIQFGGLYAIDIDTLATVAAFPASNVWMTRAGDRLYTWETYRGTAGATDLVERDPTTFAEVARFPQITLDDLTGDPIVAPDHNAFAYTAALGLDRYGVRVLPLDPALRADMSWLVDACSVDRVSDRRVAVSRGAACASADLDRTLELRDSDGRIRASAQGGYVSYWGASSLLVDGDRLIDPSTGARMPSVPGWAVAVADGRAITRLRDGGVALLRLDAAPTTAPRTPVLVAEMACSWPDFPHAAPANVANIGCADLRSAAGPRRIILSPGRQPTATSMSINAVEIDPSRRVVTVRYTQSVTSRYAGDTAQVAIVELPDTVTGEWLVWLVTDGGRPDYSVGPAFPITLP